MPKTKQSPSPVLSEEEEDDTVYEVEKIVKHRLTEEPKGFAKYEFLVRWKGYAPEQDTWEPREGIEDGAEAALSAYIKHKATRGIIIFPDGTRMSKIHKDSGKPRASEVQEIPDSHIKRSYKSEVRGSSVEEQSVRKKHESDAVSEDPQRRRKVEKPASIETPAKKRKSTKDVEIGNDDGNELADQEDIVAMVKSKLPVAEDDVPPAKKAKKHPPIDKSQTASPKADLSISVSSKKAKEEVIGSILYKDTESWEPLLTVDTLEVDVDGGYRWAVNWRHLDPADRLEWIANEVGRRRFPQKLIDFYQLHLKFKTSEDEASEAANENANGNALEED